MYQHLDLLEGVNLTTFRSGSWSATDNVHEHNMPFWPSAIHGDAYLFRNEQVYRFGLCQKVFERMVHRPPFSTKPGLRGLYVARKGALWLELEMCLPECPGPC